MIFFSNILIIELYYMLSRERIYNLVNTLIVLYIYR